MTGVEGWLPPLLSTVIGAVAAAGVLWGMWKTRVEGNSEDISDNHDKISENRDKIEQLQSETLAEVRHRESMREIRSELDQIKAEIKAIREYLLASGQAEVSDLHSGGPR